MVCRAHSRLRAIRNPFRWPTGASGMRTAFGRRRCQLFAWLVYLLRRIASRGSCRHLTTRGRASRVARIPPHATQALAPLGGRGVRIRRGGIRTVMGRRRDPRRPLNRSKNGATIFVRVQYRSPINSYTASPDDIPVLFCSSRKSLKKALKTARFVKTGYESG
jgi:hypothetical protein